MTPAGVIVREAGRALSIASNEGQPASGTGGRPGVPAGRAAGLRAGSRAGTRAGTRAGIVLGVGLGGFLDGIVLHQVLQWHHVVSSRDSVRTVRGLEINTLADGFFHLGCFVVVSLGIVMVVRARPALDRQLLGAVLAGWGLFNLVEGLVDHHLLGLHHVRPGPNQTAYDIGFLLLGAALLLGGAALARGRGSARPPAGDSGTQ